MTVPSYTEDLTDLTLAEESTGWAESTDGAWDDQGPPAYQDQDYAYIQGSYSVTADTTKTGTGTLLWDYGTTFTVPTDGAMLAWINFYNPNALDTYANGGLRMIIGSGLGTFWSWDVGGSDYGSYPYGGWQCLAVNDTVTADDTVNSYAGGSHQYVGAGCKVLTGIGKGETFQVDAIRVGRCSSIFEYGETADYCTIAGFATQNDSSSNRWGLIQAVSGGYLWKGRMQLGTATNAVDFRDSDVLIFIQDTPKVTASFNTIEIVNASSNVEMTGFQFICLDPSGTASKGRWITTNDATVTLSSCSFVDMATFTFDSNTTATSCTWKRCGQIDIAGGDISNANVLESTETGGGSAGAGAVLWNENSDPNTKIDGSTISKGAGSHHAIEFGTSAATTINLTDMTFTGFSASDQQTTSVLYFPDTGSDVTWTVTHSGTTGTVSYYKGRSGDTVSIVSGAVTVEVHCQEEDADDIASASVFLAAKDATGPFPFEETVTIVNSGTTATVTHTGHGMASNDYVFINGGTVPANEGVVQITVSGVDTYTYTMGSTPGSSPTGTIESTFVALWGTTDVNGDKSTSRVYSSNQPVKGWARKSTSSPYYKQFTLDDTISSTGGLSLTAVMSLDE